MFHGLCEKFIVGAFIITKFCRSIGNICIANSILGIQCLERPLDDSNKNSKLYCIRRAILFSKTLFVRIYITKTKTITMSRVKFCTCYLTFMYIIEKPMNWTIIVQCTYFYLFPDRGKTGNRFLLLYDPNFFSKGDKLISLIYVNFTNSA